jgi:endonuclease/exonuclease/phosphatase family metal-dependent hydrolase
MTHLSIRHAANSTCFLTALLCSYGVFFTASITVAAAVCDQVELKATHQDGIPFHHTPGGSPKFQRVPDRTVGTVIGIAKEGSWLQLRLADTRTGWISARYVARTIACPLPVPSTPSPTADERTVWTSREGCQQVVASGGRMAPSNPALLRVGTWNIRWFPRGCPSNRTCPDQTTDIPWLACTMAWMTVDLFALQEILATPDAEFSLNSLVAELNRLTGGSWQVDLQSCGGTSDQHVGFLWNSSRVTLLEFTDAWELNGAATGPTASACAGNLRPGRYALAKTPIGVDFHIVSVHFDSGTTNRDYTHRRQATQRIGAITLGGTPILQLDQDVLVLGDYNTMGREEQPPISAQEELAVFDAELTPGFRRLPMTPNCTEYFEGQGGTLDHVVASTRMPEAALTARVTGYCALVECANISGAMPVASERLSDHCPVVMEIQDRDLD